MLLENINVSKSQEVCPWKGWPLRYLGYAFKLIIRMRIYDKHLDNRKK